MDKKVLIIIAVAAFWGLSQIQTFAEPDFSKPMREEMQGMQRPPMMNGERPQNMGNHRPPNPQEFERRLNLTEEQKNLAKTQREEGVQKIKPIMDEIKVKKETLEKLQTSGASNEEITKLENEIKNLRRQTHEIRKENMKAFEATLTDTQKKELQKMKDEGRKQFEKTHKMNK